MRRLRLLSAKPSSPAPSSTALPPLSTRTSPLSTLTCSPACAPLCSVLLNKSSGTATSSGRGVSSFGASFTGTGTCPGCSTHTVLPAGTCVWVSWNSIVPAHTDAVSPGCSLGAGLPPHSVASSRSKPVPRTPIVASGVANRAWLRSRRAMPPVAMRAPPLCTRNVIFSAAALSGASWYCSTAKRERGCTVARAPSLNASTACELPDVLTTSPTCNAAPLWMRWLLPVLSMRCTRPRTINARATAGIASVATGVSDARSAAQSSVHTRATSSTPCPSTLPFGASMCRAVASPSASTPLLARTPPPSSFNTKLAARSTKVLSLRALEVLAGGAAAAGATTMRVSGRSTTRVPSASSRIAKLSRPVCKVSPSCTGAFALRMRNAPSPCCADVVPRVYTSLPGASSACAGHTSSSGSANTNARCWPMAHLLVMACASLNVDRTVLSCMH